MGMADRIKGRVSMKQIAEETGYAVITVSKALRNERDIAEGTKRIIREKARELGYVHNSAAALLRTGQSRIIAVSVVNIEDPYWSIFCKQVEKLAFAKGYSTLFFNSGTGVDRERVNIETMIRYGADGVLLAPSPDFKDNVELLRKRGIPFVIMSPNGKIEGQDATYNNERQSGCLMAGG